MSKAIIQGILVMVSCWEVIVCYQLLCGTVIEKEYITGWKKVLVCGNVIVLGTMLGINRTLLFFSPYAFLTEIIITFGCTILINRKDAITIIGVVAAYYSSMSVIDYLGAFASTLFLLKEFSNKIYLSSSYAQIGIFLGSRILVTVGVWVCVQKIKKNGLDIKEFRNILLIWSVFFYILLRVYQYRLLRISNGTEQVRGISICGSLAILVLIVVVIVRILMKNKMIKKENEFLKKRDELLCTYYRDMRENQEKNRQLVHDMKNHFIVLKEYEKEGALDKIGQYLDEISNELWIGENLDWSGNKILDIVLSEKKRAAEKQGIQVKIEIPWLAEWKFSDSDICALFGNLLDNAIEASEQVTEERRLLIVRIEKQNELLFIEISNSAVKKPLEKDGEFVTTKAEREMHGYGWKSIKRVVDKYDGDIIYRYQENMFLVRITFYGTGEDLYNE